jgi:hypothetical protein
MVTINPEPPEPPRWNLALDKSELEYLLAAFDFARMYLTVLGPKYRVSDVWPLPADHYMREIGYMEQAVAATLSQMPYNARQERR